MPEIQHVALLIRQQEDLHEGLRSSLGLAVENFYVDMIILDTEIIISDEYRENLMWLDEMDCRYFSNHQGNEKYGFSHMNVEEIGKTLKSADLIIPF